MRKWRRPLPRSPPARGSFSGKRVRSPGELVDPSKGFIPRVRRFIPRVTPYQGSSDPYRNSISETEVRSPNHEVPTFVHRQTFAHWSRGFVPGRVYLFAGTTPLNKHLSLDEADIRPWTKVACVHSLMVSRQSASALPFHCSCVEGGLLDQGGPLGASAIALPVCMLRNRLKLHGCRWGRPPRDC